MSMEEDLRILYDELDVVLLMDETTRNAWVAGFPDAKLPGVMIVSPSGTRHTEKELYNATCLRKTEICRGNPTPTEVSVFCNCTIIVSVMDPERHEKGQMPWVSEHRHNRGGVEFFSHPVCCVVGL